MRIQLLCSVAIGLWTLLFSPRLNAQCSSAPPVANPTCTQAVSSGGININQANEVVCVTGNVNLSTVNFNAAGTLVIAPGANVTGGINANSGGTLIVQGTFTWSGAANLGTGFSIQVDEFGTLNRSGDITQNNGANVLINEGDLYVSGNLTFVGSLYNSGHIYANGFNLNSSFSQLVNGSNGSIVSSQFMNVNTGATVENCGFIDVGVNLEVNSGSSFINYCHLVVHDFTQQLAYLENHCILVSGTSGTGDGFLHQGSKTVLYPGSVLITKDFFWSTNGPIELMGNAKVVVGEATLDTQGNVTAISAPGRLRIAGGAQLIGNGTLDICDSDPVSQGDNPTNVAFPAGVAAMVNASGSTSLNLYQCTSNDIPSGSCCSSGPACPGYTLNVSAQDVDCHGSSNGSLSVSASGGVAPYTYLWSNGATTANISGLSAGTYSVTVTDSNGCDEIASASLSEPTAISLSLSGTDATCGDSNGTGSASVSGGTPPYTYAWSNGATTANISGLAAGSYGLTVTDAQTCEAVGSVSISSSNGPIVNVLILAEDSCGNSTGVAQAMASGGAAPYTYLWSNGASSPLINGLSAGTYSLTVTDQNACEAFASLSIQAVGQVDTCHIVAGDFRTQTQGGWGSRPNGNNPGVYLHANFASAFPNGLTIGCTHTLSLTQAQAVTDYLPCGGPSATLSQSYTDPSCLGNTVVSQLIAATLSVTFDRYDTNFGASSTDLGDLLIASGPMAGLTVDQVLAEANAAIGGCGSAYSISQLNQTLTSINENFIDGTIVGNDLVCPESPCGQVIPPSNPGFSAREAVTLNAWPNPSSEVVNLSMIVETAGEGTLRIFGLNGSSVIRTENLGSVPAGESIFTWDGANQSGSLVLPGLYLIEVQVGESVGTLKVVRH